MKPNAEPSLFPSSSKSKAEAKGTVKKPKTTSKSDEQISAETSPDTRIDEFTRLSPKLPPLPQNCPSDQKQTPKLPGIPKSPEEANLDLLADIALEYTSQIDLERAVRLPSIPNTSPVPSSTTSSSGFVSIASNKSLGDDGESPAPDRSAPSWINGTDIMFVEDLDLDKIAAAMSPINTTDLKRPIEPQTDNLVSCGSDLPQEEEASHSPHNSDTSEGGDRGRKKKEAKRVTPKHSEFLLPAPSSNGCTTYIPNQIDFPDIEAMESGVKKTTLEYFSHMHQSWNITCRRITVDKEFLDALWSLHFKGTATPAKTMSKTLLKRHFLTLSQMFRDYAVQQPRFAKLSVADQRELLLRNTSFFIHYNLGKYFTAKSGFEQLHWILAAQIPCSWDESLVRSAPRVSFEDFTADMDLIDTDVYSPYASYFTRPLLTLRCNCILGLVLLFRSNMAALFDNMVAIDTNLEDSFSFANWAHKLYHCAGSNILCDVIFTVEKISATFNQLVRWEDLNDGLCVREFQSKIALQRTPWGGNSGEGSDWVYGDFDRVRRSFHNVSLGKDCLKDIVMHSYDVPLSGWFSSR